MAAEEIASFLAFQRYENLKKNLNSCQQAHIRVINKELIY
jgi:hypothetical protein